MLLLSRTYAVMSLAALVVLTSTCAAQTRDDETVQSSWDSWLAEDWQSRIVVRGQEPAAPLQPLDSPFSGPLQPLDSPLSVLQESPSVESWRQVFEQISAKSALDSAGAAETVTESKLYAPTNVAGLLQESNTVQTVKSQRRSPISMDPYIWGYRHGQIYANADGAYWTPVRRDLDTMLSSIDPTLIEDVIVQPGPYGLRYGPGFAYITVLTAQTPRYENGLESHYRTGFDVRTNGGGIYGRETAYGGNRDWGFIVNWGIRKASDYRPGNDAPFSKIPSGYSSQNVLAQFGMDLSAETRIEARYQRIDATDLEFAAQFFDVSYQGSDAFVVSLITEDPCSCSELRADVWFNFTRMSGDTSSPGKFLPFPVIDKVEYALDEYRGLDYGTAGLFGQTYGDVSSQGARLVKTYGEEGTTELRFGTDIRYTSQKLRENFVLTPADDFQPDNAFSTNLPRSELVDPGLFAELAIPWTSFWTTTLGARFDWAHTRADASDLRQDTSIIGAPAALYKNDTLSAFYVTSELEVGQGWTMTAGGGYAERPPSLVDRYGDGIFLGIMQSGFNRVIGTPTLRKERAWQVDLGAVVELRATRNPD